MKCIALLLLCLGMLHKVSSSESSEPSSWYNKYDIYPPYCSTPEEMAHRKIPLLGQIDDIDTKIIHVTAIIRHGARTPYAGHLSCWDDYYTNIETAVWDCNLTTYTSPPPPNHILPQYTNDNNNNIGMLLFEKKYNALYNPPILSNELNGTCQVGQLILQGYQQEIINGQYLRDAYVYTNEDYKHDPRMKLLQSNNSDNSSYIWDPLYYRTDDDQRTVMSGQILLRSLFHNEIQHYYNTTNQYPIISVHTADRNRDIVDPNENICPRLYEIRKDIEESNEYIKMNQSTEFIILRQFQNDILKKPNPYKDMDAIDCLMTTICTDRTLPIPVNDYNGINNTNNKNDNEYDIIYGTNRFQRLIDMETLLYGYTASANNGEYSKLGIGPLWSEIIDHIYPHIDENNNNINKTLLSIFSGHDTTLIPLLISLGTNVWDGIWPPYASMMIIEIHEVLYHNDDNDNDKYLFRLLFNGQIITNRIDECDTELCNISILLNRIKDFATRNINCTTIRSQQQQSDTTATATTTTTTTMSNPTESSSSTTTSAMIVIFLSGIIFGSLITYLLFRVRTTTYYSPHDVDAKHHHRHHGITRVETTDIDDDNNTNKIT